MLHSCFTFDGMVLVEATPATDLTCTFSAPAAVPSRSRLQSAQSAAIRTRRAIAFPPFEPFV
jgi:hypothetical protein